MPLLGHLDVSAAGPVRWPVSFQRQLNPQSKVRGIGLPDSGPHFSAATFILKGI